MGSKAPNGSANVPEHLRANYERLFQPVKPKPASGVGFYVFIGVVSILASLGCFTLLVSAGSLIWK